jgi:hypothetical protein
VVVTPTRDATGAIPLDELIPGASRRASAPALLQPVDLGPRRRVGAMEMVDYLHVRRSLRVRRVRRVSDEREDEEENRARQARRPPTDGARRTRRHRRDE